MRQKLRGASRTPRRHWAIALAAAMLMLPEAHAVFDSVSEAHQPTEESWLAPEGGRESRRRRAQLRRHSDPYRPAAQAPRMYNETRAAHSVVRTPPCQYTTGPVLTREQIATPWEPDVLPLRGSTRNVPAEPAGAAGVALAAVPPRVQYRAKAEADLYASKAKAIVIRHTSRHQIIAVVETVSPGNKSSRQRFTAFVDKAEQLLRSGIHLLVIDLFPPGPRDPQGIHKAIWDEFMDNDFSLPPDRPLTLAAYIGGIGTEAFVEPIAVGSVLPAMPLFLTPEVYVQVPLVGTYESAWEAMPAFWRDVLENGEHT